jgi:hypothetical protein
MRKYILLVSIIIFVVGCGKLAREQKMDKSKLLG